MIFSIETSCDETSIAAISNGKIIYHKTLTQIIKHKKFGGVIPELASRLHVNGIYELLKDFKTFFSFKEIKYVSYTESPGLIGSLQIGKLTAQALSRLLEVPLLPINHLFGHIFAASIDNKIEYPSLALIASGGHTQINLINSPHEIITLCKTNDDAIGEVFDKVARKLGFSYPGGPLLEKEAINGFANIKFPIPIAKNYNFFSFSGLKSSVINYINNERQKKNEINTSNIAASFQAVAIKILIKKMAHHISNNKNIKSIILCGGVASNKLLRKEFMLLHKNALIPKKEYCTDNAAMIAAFTDKIINKKFN